MGPSYTLLHCRLKALTGGHCYAHFIGEGTGRWYNLIKTNLGVSAVAQWVKNPTAVPLVAAEAWVWSLFWKLSYAAGVSIKKKIKTNQLS